MPQQREEIGLFVAAGDPYALECAVELDVDVEVTRVLVEMQERPGPPREVTALSLAQLRELAQLYQKGLYTIEIFLRRVPHVSSMTAGTWRTQEGA